MHVHVDILLYMYSDTVQVSEADVHENSCRLTSDLLP